MHPGARIRTHPRIRTHHRVQAHMRIRGVGCVNAPIRVYAPDAVYTRGRDERHVGSIIHVPITGVALPIELCGVRKIHYAPAQTAGRRPLTLKIYEARRHDGTRTRSLNLNVHFFYVPGDLFMKWVMAADRVSGAAPVLRQARRQPPREEEDMRYTVISCCAPSPKAC